MPGGLDKYWGLGVDERGSLKARTEGYKRFQAAFPPVVIQVFHKTARTKGAEQTFSALSEYTKLDLALFIVVESCGIMV